MCNLKLYDIICEKWTTAKTNDYIPTHWITSDIDRLKIVIVEQSDMIGNTDRFENYPLFIFGLPVVYLEYKNKTELISLLTKDGTIL